MHFPKPYFRPLPWAYRILLSVLIICFLAIGVVGLILPIIPGILFLFLAVYLCTRLSRRVRNYAQNHPWFNRNARQMDAAEHLSILEKSRLVLLMLARATVTGVQSLISVLSRK